MNALLVLLTGALFGVTVHLLLQRNMVRILMGLMLGTNAVNLLLFAMGRVTRGGPAIIPPDQTALTQPFANPLPQALILTALVISFGLLTFTMVLLKRVEDVEGTWDVDQLDDRPPDGQVSGGLETADQADADEAPP